MSDLSFSNSLKQTAGEQWNRVINHKFTTEVARGTIDRQVMKTYLIQDHRFLDAFVVLLASVIAHARCLEDRLPGCQFLALITGKENTYFERCFEKLGVTEEERGRIPDAPCTTGFINLMRKVSSGGNLGEMLSVIVVCEWSYSSWGERVLDETERDDFVCYEWVDLHSGEGFRSVVAYLRGLLDKEGELMSEEGKQRCQQKFLEAIQLEEDFFDHAYNEEK